MTACDCCGKRVDERSMATVEDGSNAILSNGPYMVCQACRGMYDDEELLEKCKEASLESSQTKSTQLKFTREQLDNNGSSGGLEIKIEGCPGDPTEDEPGTSVFIEYYEGKVQVHIWDGTSQDCQTIILKQS